MPDRRKRILFLIPSFQTGGAEIQLLSLVRGLDKQAYQITVAAFYHGGALDAEFLAVPNINVAFLEKRHPLDRRFFRRLARLLRRGCFDIVQSYNISARLLSIIYAKRFGVPYTIATERTAQPPAKGFGSRIYFQLERLAMRRADYVIANSEVGRNFVLTHGVRKDKSRVVYNGIDKQRLEVTRPRDAVSSELGLNPNAFRVGMTARVDGVKDPFTFLNAASLISNHDPSIQFLLVGDGPLLAGLKDTAKQHGISNIHFLGRRSDVANILNILDVFVLTSNRVEGCSNAILEAMMMGKPVIATTVGGNAELIEDGKTGYLIPPGNPELLVEKILMLKQNGAADLGQQARMEASRRFSNKAMVRNYERIYQNLE